MRKTIVHKKHTKRPRNQPMSANVQAKMDGDEVSIEIRNKKESRNGRISIDGLMFPSYQLISISNDTQSVNHMRVRAVCMDYSITSRTQYIHLFNRWQNEQSSHTPMELQISKQIYWVIYLPIRYRSKACEKFVMQRNRWRWVRQSKMKDYMM